MCLTVLLNMVGFANVAVVLPAVSRDLGLSSAEAGLLGGIFFAAYAIGVPLLVPLTDKVRPLLIYCVGAALWIMGGICTSMAKDGIAVALTGRLLAGLGMAATYMPGLLLLLSRLPAAKATDASATYASCFTLGTAVSFGVTGAVALHLPWQSAFLAGSFAAALAAVLALAVATVFPVQTASAAVATSSAPRFRFLTRRRMIGVLVAAFGNSWEGMALRTWWIAFLVFCAGMGDSHTMATLAIVTSMSGIVAMPMSIAVARLAQRTRRNVVLASACIVSGLFAVVSPLMVGAPLALMVIVTALYQCLTFADAGIIPGAVLQETPPERRGLGLAALQTVSNIGAFLGAAAVGYAINQFGGPFSQSAWLGGFITMGAASVLGGVVLLLLCGPGPSSTNQHTMRNL
jgi:MFS family permease